MACDLIGKMGLGPALEEWTGSEWEEKKRGRTFLGKTTKTTKNSISNSLEAKVNVSTVTSKNCQKFCRIRLTTIT